MRFRNCLGMIWSVSTFTLSSGTTTPVCLRNGCISRAFAVFAPRSRFGAGMTIPLFVHVFCETAALPHFAGLIGGRHHGLSGFALECLLKFRHVHHYTVDAVLRR